MNAPNRHDLWIWPGPRVTENTIELEGLALDVTEELQFYDSGAVRRRPGGIMAGHGRARHA